MYAQVYTRLGIVLGRYQSNPGLDHWRSIKEVLRYLKGTNDFMLMCRQTDNLEVVGYLDSNFAGLLTLVSKRLDTSSCLLMELYFREV